MPIYLYRCERCDHRFETLVPRFEEADRVKCPECDGVPERLPTSFAVGGQQATAGPTPFCGRCGENRPPCGMR